MIATNKIEKPPSKSDHIQYTIRINGLTVKLNFPKKAEPLVLDEIKHAILIGAIKI